MYALSQQIIRMLTRYRSKTHIVECFSAYLHSDPKKHATCDDHHLSSQNIKLAGYAHVPCIAILTQVFNIPKTPAGSTRTWLSQCLHDFQSKLSIGSTNSLQPHSTTTESRHPVCTRGAWHAQGAWLVAVPNHEDASGSHSNDVEALLRDQGMKRARQRATDRSGSSTRVV
jgi:hypothetical protein